MLKEAEHAGGMRRGIEAPRPERKNKQYLSMDYFPQLCHIIKIEQGISTLQLQCY